MQIVQVAENLAETPSAVARLRETGIDFVSIRPAVDVSGLVGMSVVSPSETEFEIIEALATELFRVDIRRDRFDLPGTFGSGKSYPKCVSPHFVAAFGADRKVYTCCEFLGNASHLIGDYCTEDLEQIFDYSRLESKLESLNLDKCPAFCKSESLNKSVHEISDPRLSSIL
ncbi:hypothetical protein ACFL17_06980 [Pseudomonadota bacterium]